jgi:alginate O-acetyltransferase complex protein AlgI
MLLDIHLFVISIFWAVAVFWAIPDKFGRARNYFLIAFSAFLIFLYNPFVLLVALATFCWALILYKIIRLRPHQKYLAWLVFLPMIVLNISAFGKPPLWLIGSPRSSVAQILMTLGLSYYSIKLYMTLREALKSGKLVISDALATTLFFPAFSMGPLDAGSKFASSRLPNQFRIKDFLMGVARIGIGLLKVSIIVTWIRTDLSSFCIGDGLDAAYKEGYWDDATIKTVLGFQLVSFLNLYINFSGFTDLAVGAGKMMGFKLTENFRYPLLSHSIQNFWQRWHLSISQFITKYMFKPLVRKLGRPKLSIFIVFVVVGLWHSYTVGYLIWGLAHGALLSLYVGKSGLKSVTEATPLYHPKKILGIVVTLFMISLLSAIANLGEWGAISMYLQSFLKF